MQPLGNNPALQASGAELSHRAGPRRTAGPALALILVLALVVGGFLFRYLPKDTVSQFLDHPWQSVKSSAGFLMSTSGYDGRWHNRDVDDPPILMDMRFSMHACEVTEFLPGGAVKHTRFFDGRNPPGGDGQTILTDGDRYLTISDGSAKTILLNVPDGAWEPFKDSGGRTQYKRNQKAIHLVQ